MMSRYLRGAAVIVGLALVLYGSRGLFYRFTGPSIPLPNLQGADPRVAAIVSTTTDAVKRAPQSAEAWATLGKVLRAHEFDAESNVAFRRAVELDPEEPRWTYLLARGVRLSNPDEAIVLLRQSAQHTDRVMTPQLLLGELLLDRGEVDEAEKVFRSVLARDADNPRAYLGLGRIAFGRGHVDAALDHLQRSLKLESRATETHSMLAQVYGRLGRTAEAEKERQEATRRGEWYWEDQYQDEVFELWVGLKAQLTVARNRWTSGDRDGAIELLQQTVRDYPDSSRAHFMLGDELNRLGRPAEALAPLRAAVRLDPKSSSAHFELGYALHRTGDPFAAEASYRTAIGLQPNYAVAYYNLSYALEEKADRPGAIEAIRQALRYEPAFTRANQRLAELLERSGQPGAARAARAQSTANPLAVGEEDAAAVGVPQQR